jgi:hypothetical protein
MRIAHRAITSSFFVLLKTIEVDIAFSNEADGQWTTRIELFQDTENPDHFRCHMWELEMFRLTPTFPTDENDQPLHISDDTIMVERLFPHREVD